MLSGGKGTKETGYREASYQGSRRSRRRAGEASGYQEAGSSEG